METRELWAMAVTPEQMGFYGAAQVVRLHRRFLYLKSGKQSDETVFAITGLTTLPEEKANGKALLEIARGQWGIENGNHYVRDRSYDEDRCQVRDPNSAQILATLRSLASFLAKHGVHCPSGSHQQTTPAFNRFCDAHRNQTIRWLMSPCGFK
ncbi:MAG: transposase [Verrucomicrobia bacterium]|nr:transposase [Verrucomicrobiota bacterium]MCG2680642.1 transposase [Kiritimatiellia bacterium]MBU4247433.1 transposase [Verrucomicrobiota bacterium]MBU4291491.1 transposase [Verrucomicrobiota bacterium]MBU4429674.1 transposase [Verrucomicrobiota bacterium]